MDGRKMLICQMENDHLFNTILMLLNRLDSINRQIDGVPVNLPKSLKMLTKNVFDDDELEVMQERTVETLYPYLAEAYLRGDQLDPNNFLRERMQEVFKRTGQDFDVNLIEPPKI